MLQQLVQNRDDNKTQCTQVLGSLEALYKVADMFRSCQSEFHLMLLNEELAWREDGEYDSMEKKAFKEGLHALTKFMGKCIDEVAMIEDGSLKP